MRALYITSTERHTGKKLLTIGIIDRLKRDGFKVGYFKPLGHFPVKVDKIVTDRAAWLICSLFQLEDPMELVCPVVMTRDLIMQNFQNGVTGLEEKIRAAFEKVSEDKDVVIIGCDNSYSEGSAFGVSGIRLIKLLNANALFMERYSCDVCIDTLVELKDVIGDPLIGVVFNKLKPVDLDEVKEFIAPFLSRKQMEHYGSVPEDTLLGSIGISDLAVQLNADVVAGKDNLDGLAENFLVGGMQVDKFISYVLKRPAAGIIVGGDRTDIQLVAIENGVKCLVLSGNLYPNDTIITRAEAKGVPILVTRDDTYTVAKNVEAMVGTFKLEQKDKMDHGMKLVNEMLDFERLYKKLDLVTK